MKVDTYLFGELDVSPDKVITFPNGLVAFEEARRFTLIHEEGDAAPNSFTLQSLDDPALAFQIVDPTDLGFSYELVLTEEEKALLQTPAAEDVAVMQLLFKKEEDGKSAISPNLRAPLLINVRARVGLQKVMEKISSKVLLSNLVSNV
jgi:flagellar assembly factor FliW